MTKSESKGGWGSPKGETAISPSPRPGGVLPLVAMRCQGASEVVRVVYFLQADDISTPVKDLIHELDDACGPQQAIIRHSPVELLGMLQGLNSKLWIQRNKGGCLSSKEV
jgi:hypothetical protein